VLADDHAVVRRGLQLLLDSEDDLEVVAQVGDAEAAVRTARRHKPDVLVLDLSMPGSASLDAIPLVLEASPDTKVASQPAARRAYCDRAARAAAPT
jgi:two-component system response regulator NreC